MKLSRRSSGVVGGQQTELAIHEADEDLLDDVVDLAVAR